MCRVYAFCRSRHASPRAGLIVAATLAWLSPDDRAEARGGETRLAPHEVLRNGVDPGAAQSLVVPAAKTWSVHRPAARHAAAFLTIRCRPDATPGVFVAFPDRVWHGETVVRYRLGGGRGRPAPSSPERHRSGAVRLGGSELIQEIARADVMDVLIDDLGLGASEAVFDLPRAKAAVRQIAATCRPERPGPVAAASAPRPALERRRANVAAERGPPAAEELPQSAAAPDPAPSSRGAEPVPEARPADKPEHERSERAAAPDATFPSPAAPPSPALAPPEAPKGPASADVEAVPALAPAESSPSLERPSPGDAQGRSDRVAAFVQRYGPNRQGELIYGWYRQCLDRAGIDREQIWYLSDERLTYLARGETDQVRLSMLVSTSGDLGVPPRRVTCSGTARGRDLTVEQVEQPQ